MLKGVKGLGWNKKTEYTIFFYFLFLRIFQKTALSLAPGNLKKFLLKE